MEERKGDPRILIISGLIFFCIISGGALLCIYLFLPESQSRQWFPIVGMILVGAPWAFWLFIYLYNCFKPAAEPQLDGFSSSSKRPSPATSSSTSGANPHTELPVNDSPGRGQRHVHFGAVVVMDSQRADSREEEAAKNNNHESHSKETGNNSIRSRESELPLRSSISS